MRTLQKSILLSNLKDCLPFEWRLKYLNKLRTIITFDYSWLWFSLLKPLGSNYEGTTASANAPFIISFSSLFNFSKDFSLASMSQNDMKLTSNMQWKFRACVCLRSRAWFLKKFWWNSDKKIGSVKIVPSDFLFTEKKWNFQRSKLTKFLLFHFNPYRVWPAV